MTITPSIISVTQIDSSGLAATITSPVSPIVGFQIEVKKNSGSYVPLSARNKLEADQGYMLFVGAQDTQEAIGQRNSNVVFLTGYIITDTVQFRVRNFDEDDAYSAWIESAVYEITEQVQSFSHVQTTPLNFNFFTNDFNLYNGCQNEVIQQNGIDTFYLPKQYQKIDLVLGEDVLSKFNQSYPMKMYLASFTEFGGDGILFGNFGLTVTEQVTLEVNITYFAAQTSNYYPVEGDLIFLPISNFVFEIFRIVDVDPFFHLGKTSKYIFEVRRIEYSGEEMDTGIAKLDELESLQDTDIESESDELEDELNDILNSSEPNIFGDR